ncbi:group II intron reverse transcriptase/maturase [Escherichia coli]|uniref:group II intron reverse transcriptase/maturase n=1 Tax=Escherichia coli TaxID=562 RepID=UPI000B7E5A08|nr:group II intron reverse transcriptase/maturase [Escherichia coli]EFJ8930310.1 group II intron reverse transcriptase/maturase [Escherichia coli]MBA8291962.1 group II intron reverse transcriptase/maturase [Escherichia coli]MBC1060749.1 group II intron reverse transcriptase/maturase [Escherichia coli]QMA67196.1 group II intron reverse transcriptase/maturase [Escherichia coli]QMG10083.1 group II intron reverse transcriptase/maturase [Escherichia coli]
MMINEAQAQATAASGRGDGQYPSGLHDGAEISTAAGGQTKAEVPLTMEAVITRENLMLAYQRVVENKGVAELKPWLKKNWRSVWQALIDGNYQPRAIRRMDIPKPDGGVRTLGIPTVVDRLIQQAIAQQLSAIVDKSFSDSSYGFRPGRNPWQAVQQAQRYIRGGKRWVVDMDLEKFFDRVDHRLLMTRLTRTIKDRRVLRLIRRYLKAEMVKDGQREKRQAGMPQGGPLSPLLSNILLDELDKELERRGHSFCRYADDCNIYVSSRKAGDHLLKDIRAFVENKLKLKVNEKKSAVARPWERKFLGYSVTWHKQAKLKIALTSVNRLKEKVRSLTTGNRSKSVKATINALTPVLRGWISYFRLTEVRGVVEELDGWIKRKLRCLLWRQWKRPRTRAKNLQRAGLSKDRAMISAYNNHGPWWNSGSSHMNQAIKTAWFRRQGLISLLEQQRQFQC